MFVCVLRKCRSGNDLACVFWHLGGDISQLPQLLLSVCETVKDEALALIDNMRHTSQLGDTVEDEDSMETDSPRGPQKDQRDGVSVVRLLLMKVQVYLVFWSILDQLSQHVLYKHTFFLPLNQVCVLALHLAKELCRTDEDGEHWVSVMRKVPLLPSVLSAVELSLRMKRNLYFTEAALHLLLTLARTPQVNTNTPFTL